MSPFLSIGVRKQDHHKPKSLSTLYSLITILKSKQNWICREVKQQVTLLQSFPWSFSKVLGPFQSLSLMLSDQDVRLHHKMDSLPSPDPQGCWDRELSDLPDRMCR